MRTSETTPISVYDEYGENLDGECQWGICRNEATHDGYCVIHFHAARANHGHA